MKTLSFGMKPLRIPGRSPVRPGTLEAKDAGYLNPNKVNRQWLVTDDDRLDVNICEPMDGQEVGLEESFRTGDGRSVMHPTAHPDCRCSMRLRFNK